MSILQVDTWPHNRQLSMELGLYVGALVALYLCYSEVMCALVQCVETLPYPGLAGWGLPAMLGRQFNRQDNLGEQLIVLLLVCFTPVGVRQWEPGWLGGSRLFIYGNLTIACVVTMFWADGGWQIEGVQPFQAVIQALASTLGAAALLGAIASRPRRVAIWIEIFLPLACVAWILASVPSVEWAATTRFLGKAAGIFLPCGLVALAGLWTWLRRGEFAGASLALACLWTFAAVTGSMVLLPYH